MRMIRTVKDWSVVSTHNSQSVLAAAAGPAMVARVNRARGAFLERTGKDVRWTDLARLCSWKPSTATDVKLGKRPLRVLEVAQIAWALGARAGFIAFGEEPMIPSEALTKADELVSRHRQPSGPDGDELLDRMYGAQEEPAPARKSVRAKKKRKKAG